MMRVFRPEAEEELSRVLRSRGAVRIISQKEIRHYRNAGVAIAAGAESEWFIRTARMRRTLRVLRA